LEIGTSFALFGFMDKQENRRATSYNELRVYRNAMDVAMEIYLLTKKFPDFEKYSMVDQIRKSSRSVCANIAEAWRKRRYKAAFIAKLSDAESEACETQVWLEFANRCRYIDENIQTLIDRKYHLVISQLVKMINSADRWLIK
jgi:four helix bundle protein